MALSTQTHLASKCKKSRAVALLPLWTFVACSRSNMTFFTSYGRTYSKAHQSHFTEFSTVSDHNNFVTRTVLADAPIIISNPQFFSDTNYVTSYNYRVSFMGVAFSSFLNSLNSELNPICYLLALLAHHFLHVSRIRVKSLTLK